MAVRDMQMRVSSFMVEKCHHNGAAYIRIRGIAHAIMAQYLIIIIFASAFRFISVLEWWKIRYDPIRNLTRFDF